jgi:hypothetical protein
MLLCGHADYVGGMSVLPYRTTALPSAGQWLSLFVGLAFVGGLVAGLLAS